MRFGYHESYDATLCFELCFNLAAYQGPLAARTDIKFAALASFEMFESLRSILMSKLALHHNACF